MRQGPSLLQIAFCLAGLAAAGCPSGNSAADYADLQAHLPTGLPFVQPRKNARVRRMLMELMPEDAKSEVGDRDLLWAGIVRPLDGSSRACIVAVFQRLIGPAGGGDARLFWAPADDFRSPMIARVDTPWAKYSIMSVVSSTQYDDLVRFEIGAIDPEFVVDLAFTADAPLIVNARRYADGAFTIRESSWGASILDVTLHSRPPVHLRVIEDWRRLALGEWTLLDPDSPLAEALHEVRRALEAPAEYTGASLHGNGGLLSPWEPRLFVLYMGRDVVRLPDKTLNALVEASGTKRNSVISTLRDAGVDHRRLKPMASPSIPGPIPGTAADVGP